MKSHQFEEITAALSIIIALLAYKFEVNWLFYIYFAKSCFDTWCALKEAFVSAYKKRMQNKKEGENNVASVIGVLSVSDAGNPQVITQKGIYPLSGCRLTQHSDGTWNFNMMLSGLYKAYKEGQTVSGMVGADGTFNAWLLVK